jgi:hypothetical protein
VGRADRARHDQAQTAIEESARIAKESIAYQQKLAAEWRKIFMGGTNGAA